MDLLILASASLNCLVCFCYLLIFSALNPHSLIPSLAVSNLFNLTTEFLNFNDFYFHFPPNLPVFSVLFLIHIVYFFFYTHSNFKHDLTVCILFNYLWFSEEYLILLFVALTKFCCNVPCNLRVWTHIHQGFSCRIFFFFSLDGIHIISEYLYVWFCQMSHRYHWLATVFNSNIMGIIWLHSELQTYSWHFSDKESENMRANDLSKMMDLSLWYIDHTDHTPTPSL